VTHAHDTAMAALAYIARGWAVIPLHDVAGGTCSCGSADPHHPATQGGKHPLQAGWQNRGIRDAATARETWAARPSANIGIVTGRASGLWVLDVDPEHQGDAKLAALIGAYGMLPSTHTVRTGSGGQHYYWRMPDFDFTTSRGQLPVGLDVRGNNGQVVAPPSYTLKGSYSVVLETAVADAPAWLLDLIRPRTPAPDPTEARQEAGAGGWVASVEAPTGLGAIDADRGRLYAHRAVREVLNELRAAIPGERNSKAYRAGRRLAELISSPWSGLDAYVDQIWAGYMQACAFIDTDGGFTQTEAYDTLRKAVRDQGGRGAALPPADFYGVVTGWQAPPSDFDQAGQGSAIPGIFTPVAAPGTLEQPLDPFESAVRVEMGRQMVRDEAKRRIVAAEFLSSWREPITHGDLAVELSLPESETVWRVAGLLPADGNSVVVAPRKTGKTTLIGELVRSLVDGIPFLGHTCTAVSGGVALFNYENTERQQRAWLRALGIVNQDQVHVLHLRGSALNLNVAQVRAYVTSWLQERAIEVWIPDPYLRAAQGVVLNENDNGQANIFTGILDEIKLEAGVKEIVMPAHSSNKNEVESGAESMRGAGRVEDWADAIWYLTSIEGQRFIRATGRDVELPETQMQFDSTTRHLSIPRPGHGRKEVAIEGDVAAISKILREWSEATPATQNQLAEACGGWRAQRVRAAVVWLVDRNLAWVENGPNNSKYHHHGPRPQSLDSGATGGAT
jgi:bifunctional DNA primase/polymerase-like protein/AAA domain-containing protein